jgi:hypothetical protein
MKLLFMMDYLGTSTLCCVEKNYFDFYRYILMMVNKAQRGHLAPLQISAISTGRRERDEE